MKRYKVPISIIMPCYNSEAYIAKAIESILKQTYPFFEFIIINDCSTDRTELEIKKFKDSRIKYIKCTTNKGNNVVRNIAMKTAKGKYICMMDSDDIAFPNRLELQYNFLQSHKHIGFLGGAFEIIDQNDNIIREIKSPLNHSTIKTYQLKDCFIKQPTLMLRSHLITKHGLFYNEDYKYASDYDLFVRASNFFPIKNLKDVLIKYRIHSNQISSNKKIEQTKIADIIRKEQLKQFKIKPTEKEISLHLKLMKEEYLNDENLRLCEAWCNKLLESNEKFKPFNSNTLYKLLEYLLQIALKNNSLGGWSIEKNTLNFINTIISKGDSILEFGSGMGTEALLEKYKVTSIEHDKAYCYKRGENHNILHAPIENKWYDKQSVLKVLEKEHDLIIIDGPPGELRAGILQNIHLFDTITSPIIFDDVNRPFDKEVMMKFCNEIHYSYKIVKGTKKEFALCTKINSSINYENDDVSNNKLQDFNNCDRLSSAILLLTNKTHKEISQKFKLLNKVGNYHQAYVLLHVNPKDKKKNHLKNTRVYPFESDILKNLGYTSIGDNLLPGSNHFPLLKFYREKPEFDFYWCIEDDVFYNGDWSEFFDFFIKNKSSDFISSNIIDFDENINWYWWDTLYHKNKFIPLQKRIRSLNPIYRLSNKALSYIDDQLKNGWQGHHEVLIPTLLNQGGFIIEDFGGIGRYVNENCKNRFYSRNEMNQISQLSNSSMRYRPFIREEEITEKLLYHPVKFQE